MTSKRDLGAPLAYAGLAVVVAAVIAGFIAVGGPGDARDRRLDQNTTDQLYDMAYTANCAFALDGKLPATQEEVRASIASAAKANPDKDACKHYSITASQKDVEYSRLADDRMQLCARFRRPSNAEEERRRPNRNSATNGFPELAEAHPAGRHCYEIQLAKPQPVPLR